MAQKKQTKKVKVRHPDLKPRKDAKGGVASRGFGPTKERVSTQRNAEVASRKW